MRARGRGGGCRRGRGRVCHSVRDRGRRRSGGRSRSQCPADPAADERGRRSNRHAAVCVRRAIDPALDESVDGRPRPIPRHLGKERDPRGDGARRRRRAPARRPRGTRRRRRRSGPGRDRPYGSTTSWMPVLTTGRPAARYSGVLVGLMYRVASLCANGIIPRPSRPGRPEAPRTSSSRGSGYSLLGKVGGIDLDDRTQHHELPIGPAPRPRPRRGRCPSARRSRRSSRSADADRPSIRGVDAGSPAPSRMGYIDAAREAVDVVNGCGASPRSSCAPPVSTRSACSRSLPRARGAPAGAPLKPARWSMQSKTVSERLRCVGPGSAIGV